VSSAATARLEPLQSVTIPPNANIKIEARRMFWLMQAKVLLMKSLLQGSMQPYVTEGRSFQDISGHGW
jgi:hypothetical protein